MRIGQLAKFILALGLGVVSAVHAHAILGRHDVDPRQYYAQETLYPAVFGLFKTADGYNDCMGTLIDPHWAITAAHCTTEIGSSGKVLEEAFEVETASGPSKIDMVVRYRGFRIGQDRDIALLRFQDPITNIQPIELYREADEVAQKVIILGWGDTGNGQTGVAASDGIFRKAENRVDEIAGVWLKWGFDDPSLGVEQALPLEGIAGPGDSGGPAFIETETGLKIAGISSGQDPLDQKAGTYGVHEYYVRVSPLAGWADRVMELNPPATPTAID